MLTLEHINKGADHYERLSLDAKRQSEYHTRIGSGWDKEWLAKSVEYANIVEQLRALITRG